jgi:hypothetical protein
VSRFRTTIRVLVMCAVCVSCRGSTEGDPSADGGVFIAFARDFTGFDSWMSFDLGAITDDGIAVVGTRKAYINHIPPSGSTTFPIGTALVKTIAADTAAPGQTFAMVKRGGAYNVQGALGWEWFELTSSNPVAPAILWRGITPPAGGAYADCPDVVGGSCNNCHVASRNNDYVPSDALALSQF